MELSRAIQDSLVFARFSADDELRTAIVALRSNVAALANTIGHSVPSFTDHSIRHMDALWGVTERVLTKDEIASMTPAEAFLLATGYYLHDIGMAYAATEQGLEELRTSAVYKATLKKLCGTEAVNPASEAQAISLAVRKMHADVAIHLAENPVPGTEIHLFEPRSMREDWATTCGQIAASHHWSLDRIQSEFGMLHLTALPGNRTGDLGYVAAILRIVDYAHINRDRAPTIERAFRLRLEDDSLIHWLAQEKIDGPMRDGGYLVYRAASPVADIDAWWLYFDMLKGLDDEVRTVRRYLDRRPSSIGRFSLEGVAGAESSEAASVYIRTSGFMPIEVNIRTGSIERLVELLAGESLYGKDPMAAVRELIQNARDAVTLKEKTATTNFERAALSLPIRVALNTGESPSLEVTDWGIGMTDKVMTDYLITLASDYWSTQFHIDFPTASGFEPAGKFGIGFLSVFMLGDVVTVESNRLASPRYELRLGGVGRRGEMKVSPTQSGSGTAVRIRLKQAVLDSFKSFAEQIRVYAPMLAIPVEVAVDNETTTISPGWIFKLSADDFRIWTLGAVRSLAKVRDSFQYSHSYYLQNRAARYLHRMYSQEKDLPWRSTCPEFVADRTRLIASFEGSSLLCLKGLALQSISTPGFVGIIDIDTATTDASRKQALNADVSEILSHAKMQIRNAVVENLDVLGKSCFVVNEMEFISQCVELYGPEVLMQSTIPWVSLIQQPGDVRQIPSDEFLAEARNSQSVFFAYDMGPWTAIKKWSALVTSSRIQNEIGIVLNGDHDHRGPGYISGNEVKIGSLRELWPECNSSLLLGTILRLTSEAWQVNIDYLVDQRDWHHEGSILWGRFLRP